MFSPNVRDASADDLLERIRNLKKLLKSDIPLGATAAGEMPGSPKGGNSSPDASQNPRQLHLSPPTRDFSSERNMQTESSADQDLIEETWHLLSQVTYVRIVIDRLTWDESPKILLDAMSKRRSPRQKSLIFLEYCFPMITADDGSLSARDLSKRMLVPAKDILRKVTHFNHRRVLLLRMTQPVLQLWSQSYFTIKVFCGSKPNSPIGRCVIPLCKLLVLPFSLDADIPVEMTNENSKGRGNLKVCIQLGSRFQSFTERVEPMRNPTTAIDELAFIDPMKLITRQADSTNKAVTNAPEKVVPPLAATSERESSTHGSVLASGRRFAEEGRDRGQLFQSLSSRSDASPKRQHQAIYEGRRLNETFTGDLRAPSPLAFRRDQHQPSWRSNIDDNAIDEPAWLRYLLQRKGAGLDSGRSNIAEPYVSNVSVYGNRITVPPISRLDRNDYDDFAGRVGLNRPMARDNERIHNHASIRKTSDAAAQTSIMLEDTELANNSDMQKSLRNSRRPTVAEKLLKNRPSIDLDNRIYIPSPSNHRGTWLQLTLHRARNLPLMKDNKSRHGMIKPICYWTYVDDSGTCYTPTSVGSCDPVWEWSKKIYIPADRKTLVLKLWHKANGGRDRVLGFVAIVFPIVKPFERVWYDIIDLTRSSSGQVELSFDENIHIPEEHQQQTHVATNSGPNVDDLNEQQNEPLDTRLSPVDFSPMRNAFLDAEVNTTTAFMAQAIGNDKRSSCSSPFISLTSRSFLTRKLRTDMEELSTLMAQLKRDQSFPAAPVGVGVGVTSVPDNSEIIDLEEENPIIEELP